MPRFSGRCRLMEKLSVAKRSLAVSALPNRSLGTRGAFHKLIVDRSDCSIACA